MTKRDDKPTGLTQNTGWKIGVRRTFPISHLEAWRLITSSTGLKIWLGDGADVSLAFGSEYELADGSSGEIRVFIPDSHLRVTWQPIDWPRSSTIQVRVIPKGDKSVISFHQERLPGAAEREERQDFFRSVLDELEKVMIRD
ncbi:MAG: SRPBCC domain-containing protein [Chloroflexi bacterium]|nr:SRPBCC domain-containing protein [Chloroflexota bacterium]